MEMTVIEFEIVIADVELKLELRSFYPGKDPETDLSHLFVGDTMSAVFKFVDSAGIAERMTAVDRYGRHTYIVRIS
jgi:hypothetical protein